MEVYEKVVQAIKETNTLSWHIKNLGKLKLKTEDDILISQIEKAIKGLQFLYSHCEHKSEPGSIDKLKRPEIKDLFDYCNNKIGFKKPEWQILAERHGWLPPKK